MSNLVPSAGEDSPHAGVLRISWEISPVDQKGFYGSIPPVDVGLLLMRTDKKTFKECKVALEIFLKKLAEEKDFIHIFRPGGIL
jgi:hypothetical protein